MTPRVRRGRVFSQFWPSPRGARMTCKFSICDFCNLCRARGPHYLLGILGTCARQIVYEDGLCDFHPLEFCYLCAACARQYFKYVSGNAVTNLYLFNVRVWERTPISIWCTAGPPNTEFSTCMFRCRPSDPRGIQQESRVVESECSALTNSCDARLTVRGTHTVQSARH